MRAESYIGVSGIASCEKQASIIEAFEQLGFSPQRTLMLGVKALHKCQWLDQPWKRDDEWDVVGEEAFKNALCDDQKSLNIAQAYFDRNLVGDPAYRDAFLKRIYERGEGWINGIQYDMLPWHENPDTLRFLHQTKERYPDTKVILQCWKGTLERYDPKQLVRVLAQHAEALDYVLFDVSHGMGRPIETEGLLPYVEATYDSDDLRTVGVSLAGGLGGEQSMDEIKKVLALFPDISWDAESKLHPRQQDGSMPLDIPSVKHYFELSAKALTT